MDKTVYGLAENSRTWKGDKASYHAMHSWIRGNYGKPNKCQKCGLIGKKEGNKRPRWNIEYALKDNIKPSRNIKDYLCLCKSCHRKMDMTDEIKKNISLNKKGKRLGIPNLWKRKEYCIRGHKRELNIPCKECKRIISREWYQNKYARHK